MSEPVLQLYPRQQREPLAGLYLRQPLIPAGWGDKLFVYSNFVTSIDGRIATTDPRTGRSRVPPEIANPRDWRLFQELAAQADILLTSGRFLRELRDGRAQDVLPLSRKEPYADLHRWRRNAGMPAQPDVAVLSYRLDFPLPSSLLEQGRRILIFTPADPQSADGQRLRDAGAEIVSLDGGKAAGATLARTLQASGYRRLYSVTGPKVLQTLVAGGALHALFVTTVTRLLGGAPATTLLEGTLDAPLDFDLTSLYFDPTAKEKNIGQCLARYDLKV